jgi:hypothetical protein
MRTMNPGRPSGPRTLAVARAAIRQDRNGGERRKSSVPTHPEAAAKDQFDQHGFERIGRGEQRVVAQALLEVRAHAHGDRRAPRPLAAAQHDAMFHVEPRASG